MAGNKMSGQHLRFTPPQHELKQQKMGEQPCRTSRHHNLCGTRSPSSLSCGLCDEPFYSQLDAWAPSVCGHLFCQKCLVDYVLQWNILHEKVVCPCFGCGSRLAPQQLERLLSDASKADVQCRHFRSDLGKGDFEKSLLAVDIGLIPAATSIVAAPSICPICFEQHGRMRDLDCGHGFCHECLSRYLGTKIAEARVADDDLNCPIPGCEAKISVLQVQDVTRGTPSWDRFLQFRATLWRPRSIDGVLVDCVRRSCGARFLVPLGRQFVECPECGVEFCSICKSDSHGGMTCDEGRLQNGKASDSSDGSFEHLMAECAWRRCPACGVPSERESGCNFMQCESMVCRQKGRARTFWCYVCGLPLGPEEHYSHYPEGPFADVCHASHLLCLSREPSQRNELPGSRLPQADQPPRCPELRPSVGPASPQKRCMDRPAAGLSSESAARRAATEKRLLPWDGGFRLAW